MLYTEFKKEIALREGTGYHIISKYDEDARLKYASRNISVYELYFNFINDIGFGSFFDGSLVIFSLDDGEGSVLSTTSHLRQIGFDDLISIGYDGTTSGYFCLSMDAMDEKVYWVDFDFRSKEIIDGFYEWIESLPKRLFNEKIFSGFKKIKDLHGVLSVIAERRKFTISLLSFDSELVRPPGQENDVLPRFNRVILQVVKRFSTWLKELTVPLIREGSSIGGENKGYVTINVGSLEVGSDEKIECYLFDPFNLTFEVITCNFDYRIDLGSKSRTKYKEIVGYL